MHSARILFAHDDATFGRTLTWILNEHDYQVTPSAASEALFTPLDGEPWDLLVLETADGEAGLDLLKRIKENDRHADLPVLLLSPLDPEEGSITGLGLGAADVLAPPFKAREILARIKAQLRAGRALNRARAEARSRAEMVGILREIASTLTPDEIYMILVRRVAQGLGISRCSILLAGPDPGTATVVAAYENPVLRNLRVDLERYPEIQRAIETNTVVLIGQVESDPLYSATRESWKAEGHRVDTTSALAIPFTLKGEQVGVFFLRTSGEDAVLTELDLQFADQVIRSAVGSIEKAYDLEEAVADHRHLRQMAENDPLTGLHNRRALEQRIGREMEQAARYQTVLSCLLIDVDNFKETNDRYGHQVGDRVLSQLAGLLRREQRAIDVVARYGGEEFCVVLPLTGSSGARILADRILRRVSTEKFGDPDRPITVTVSIGIATYPDDRITDGQALLRVADDNMRKAKSDGKNRYRE